MTKAVKKKKICFFSGDITRSGGTERVAVMIAGRLAKLEKFEIMFLSIVEQKDALFFQPICEIPRYVLSDSKKWISPGPRYLPLIPRLRRFLKEKQIDLIIDIDTVLDVLTVPAAAGLPVKHIAWEHFNYYYEWPSPVYRQFRKCVSRFTASFADYIVTLTERDMQNYRQKLGRKDRICAIYNPMEFTSEEEKTVEREKILITVGRLTKVKGTDLLAEIAPVILSQQKDWKWYVLGEGEDRKILEQARDQYQLQDQLILTGNVSDVEQYLRKASIYVMTSRAEGLPMCLLEAMGCEVACVSFDIQTGPAEIIEDGKNGFLIPAFDREKMEEKILKLIEDPGLRKSFQKNAKSVRSRFEPDGIIRQWETLLELLMQSGDQKKK